MPADHDIPVTLELYVRSLSSSATGTCLESIVNRLSSLSAAGTIDEYSIMIWGERVSTDSGIIQTEPGAMIRRRVVEFKHWGDENGMTLGGGFDKETVHSSITGETHEFITLPAIALAARTNGQLDWVAPAADGAETWTPLDRLNAMDNDVVENPGRVVMPSDD